jgi:2-polyprenyl-3-methyl-5-hydroxy-6-metoxy-1,4-benzoquinol methylase
LPVTDSDQAILTGGHYARKQIFSRSRIVSWSHTRRFATALALCAPFQGRKLLDYGCGDGTFLALAREMFPGATGADVGADQVADCALRLSVTSGLAFVMVEELRGSAFAAGFDVVVCMEVLEHCPPDIRTDVLDDLVRLTSSGGVLIVSVPIETGLSLAAKQTVRGVSALAGLTEYATRERYRFGEFVRMFTAGGRTAIPREETALESNGRIQRFTGHKGFNWRVVESELAVRFKIQRRLFSPIPRAGSFLNSQVWFVCCRH